MDTYLTFNLTNPHPLLILKNFWSTTHHLVRVAEQFTKHMRTYLKFLKDGVCILAFSEHGTNCFCHRLQ